MSKSFKSLVSLRLEKGDKFAALIGSTENRTIVKTQQARDLGKRVAALVQTGQMTQAYALLSPVLAERTPFPLLGRIGEAVGAGPLEAANAFLGRIASDKTEGGWVVIGSALGQQLDRDLAGAFARCRAFIVGADVWYAADILGERVPGPALVADFQPSLALLAAWREDANRWVRRAVGVSVHFWAKRSRGAAEHTAQAEALLAFLEPMFEEWEMDAVKGVGWGLKTLGRHYPDLVADWLAQQVVQRQRRHRALMLRKALTYLSDEQRARVTGGDPSGFSLKT
jgi:3-methyladenine DNA glycosylase AlkD